MKRFIIDIYQVWMHELKVVFRDPAIIVLFIIVPLGYPLLYAAIYDNEIVTDVPVLIVDNSNSALSREFKRKLDAAPDVKVVGYALNMEQAKDIIARRDAYGVYYIPSDFAKNINRGKQASVLLYADMSSLLYYKGMMLSANEVCLNMGGHIRVEEMKKGTRAEDIAAMQPVENEWVAFYNVQNGFASFLIPAVLILIIQQTLFLGIATLLGTHRDRKTFTVASHANTGKKISALRLTIGKAFCYSSFYMIGSVWMLRVVPYIFDLPQIGDPMVMAVFLMPFLLGATFFCMTLSYFCSQREFAMLLFAFTSPLFIFLSGVSWPWTAMPDALKAIAYILPSTPGIHGFVKINTMGATLSDVWFEYCALWIQAAVYCCTSVFMYRWWIQNYDPKYKGQLRPESE